MNRDDGDEDIRAVLEDLRATLDELADELGAVDDGDGRTAGRRGPHRRPPSPGELLRFTDEYTIPTLIALLEATTRSLELLRGVIRLLDPDRGADGERREGARTGVGASADAVASGASTALAELRRALRETDLPPDAVARDVVVEARELSAELEELLAETRERRTASGERETGGRRSGESEPISIEVDDGDGSTGAGEPTAEDGDGETDPDERDGAGADARAEVDVESELASIREEVTGAEREESNEEGAGSDRGDEDRTESDQGDEGPAQ